MSGGMGDLSDEAARETDEVLRDQEVKLLAETKIDWKRLRPEIADQQTYDALAAAVQAATSGNETLAQLKVRVQSLGKEGAAVARKVLKLATRV